MGEPATETAAEWVDAIFDQGISREAAFLMFRDGLCAAADGARLEVLNQWKAEQQEILAGQQAINALIRQIHARSAALVAPSSTDPVAAAREAVVKAAMKQHAMMCRPFDPSDEDFNDNQTDDAGVARSMLYSACAALAALEKGEG